MTYMLWQFNTENPLSDEVRKALNHYMKKYGSPPSLLEHSGRLENVQLPEDMNLVVEAVRIPKNILLIG